MHFGNIKDPKCSDPLPRSNEKQLILVRDAHIYPPRNKGYKPNGIDIKTISKTHLSATDMANDKICIHWDCPRNVHHDISYRILMGDQSLTRYLLPLSHLKPEIDGEIYESTWAEVTKMELLLEQDYIEID